MSLLYDLNWAITIKESIFSLLIWAIVYMGTTVETSSS
jgi:hypothetical protein